MSYFLRNPRAADSFEGVVRWRLLDEVVHRTVEETHRALDWLVVQGFLIETSTAGFGPIFRFNPERRADAERFLATTAESRNGPSVR